MSERIEIPEVQVGQNVILLGKSWEHFDLRGHEVTIAGKDYEDYSAEVVPLDDEDPAEVAKAEENREVFSAAVAGHPENAKYAVGDEIVLNPVGEAYFRQSGRLAGDRGTVVETPADYISGRHSKLLVTFEGNSEPVWVYEDAIDPYEPDQIEEAFQMRDWDTVERLITERQEEGLEELSQEAENFTLEIPGVGFGVATSQEDYDAMKTYAKETLGYDVDAQIEAFIRGDAVKPDHYQFGDVRVIDIVKYLPFPEGNVIKYVARAGRKGSKVEDLHKARRYLDIAIEQAEAEQ